MEVLICIYKETYMMKALTCGILSANFYGATVTLKRIDYIGSVVLYRFYKFIHIGYRNVGKKSYRCNSK